MSRLTRDGTAEPVSRDQILRHARGQGNIIFPVQLITSRIGNLTRLIHTLLYMMTIHIQTYGGGGGARAQVKRSATVSVKGVPKAGDLSQNSAYSHRPPSPPHFPLSMLNHCVLKGKSKSGTGTNRRFVRYFQHAHFIPVVGVGKRGADLFVDGDLPRQDSLGTTLRFTGPAPADSRQ